MFITVIGFITGILIGLTGTGGGVLLTPLLMVLTPYPAVTLIGTDIVNGAFTKLLGVFEHRRLGQVRWRLATFLIIGTVPGTIGGILGIDDGPRFHEYVAHQKHPSYHYGDLRIGAILPPDGVTYYDIPGEYHVQGYRYAYVNDHAVLVDPQTRQIVEIVD